MAAQVTQLLVGGASPDSALSPKPSSCCSSDPTPAEPGSRAENRLPASPRQTSPDSGAWGPAFGQLPGGTPMPLEPESGRNCPSARRGRDTMDVEFLSHTKGGALFVGLGRKTEAEVSSFDDAGTVVAA